MRAGWKALLLGGAAALLVSVAGVGCGDSKEPTKAQTDSQLKQLPPPGAPGEAPAADSGAKGKKNAASGAPSAGSQ